MTKQKNQSDYNQIWKGWVAITQKYVTLGVNVTLA
jgi:hypothetical protein